MVKIIKPNLKFNGVLQPINKNKVDKLVEHHMAHKTWDIYDVHNYHKNGNGWIGIGYNYWIGFDGTIYEARGFNIGAHVGGHNSHTIGVGYQGDFTQQTMSDAQLKAGIALNKWLIDQFPNISSKVQLFGHRDLAATSCPGKHFPMINLKNGVGGKSIKPVKPSTGTSKTKWTTLSGDWTGQTLKNNDHGQPVKQLQTKLSNNNPPFYPNKGAKNNGIDGYYGTDTEDAVRRYQIYYNLSHDGMAGRQVYNKLTDKATSQTSNMDIDGKWGRDTTRALQRALKTTVDGIISGQPKNAVTQAIYGGVKYGSKGSPMVKELQRKLGAKPDGKLGPATIKALQKHLGSTVDGKLSKPSLVVRKMQDKLNAGTF